MDRVERARARGHARRTRWQRMCATIGFGMILFGVGVSSYNTCTFVYGAYAFIVGPAMLFTSVLPALHSKQTYSIKLIVPTALLFLGCYHGVHIDAAPIPVNTIHAYATTMLIFHTIYILYAWRSRARLQNWDVSSQGRRLSGNPLILSTNVYRNAMLCYVPVGIIWGVAIRNDNVPCALPDPWWLRLISHGGLSITSLGMSVLMQPWWNEAIHAFVARWSEGALIAGSISDALITGNDERRSWQTIETRMRDAHRTFRGVNMALLTLKHLSQPGFSHDAYEISVPVKIGMVDAFISHSWHDDADEKWRLLQEWRSAFKQRYCREPMIWIDRCCIDQTAAHFKDMLNYLPIYLAGCKTLLALIGPTYPRRLWCVIELYVFHELRSPDSRIDVLSFSRALSHRAAPEPPQACRAFDVRNATCTYGHDTSRLMRVINLHCHMESFNAWVRVLLRTARNGMSSGGA